MSLFCVQTHDLSWQDRTINIELMMAPARSQLLYNKHKGLKTKFDQEHHYLEREKETFLKNFKIDCRLMERKKDRYSKLRNDIILKRSTNDRLESDLLSSSVSSAPVRLKRQASFDDAATFITEFKPRRETQSAAVRQTPEQKKIQLMPIPEVSKLVIAESPELAGSTSPCMSMRSPTPGRPFFTRDKSVRFHGCCPHATKLEPLPVELPIETRMQRFLDTQTEFNNREPMSLTEVRKKLASLRKPVGRRSGGRGIGMNMAKLEDAFDKFMEDDSPEEWEKLVKYANKMKATVRNARNSCIMPRRSSVLVSV